MKYFVFNMCRIIKILISNWPRKLKFSQFLQAGKTCQLLLTFLTKVTRWSRSTSNFYALIGQNLTGEFMRKIYAASSNLFTLLKLKRNTISPIHLIDGCQTVHRMKCRMFNMSGPDVPATRFLEMFVVFSGSCNLCYQRQEVIHQNLFSTWLTGLSVSISWSYTESQSV